MLIGRAALSRPSKWSYALHLTSQCVAGCGPWGSVNQSTRPRLEKQSTCSGKFHLESPPHDKVGHMLRENKRQTSVTSPALPHLLSHGIKTLQRQRYATDSETAFIFNGENTQCDLLSHIPLQSGFTLDLIFLFEYYHWTYFFWRLTLRNLHEYISI